jgi:RNA polymerase sigma factor (sigma-70 family)
MRELAVQAGLAERLHREADALRWGVALERFTRALQASLGKAFSGGTPGRRDAERYLASLHLGDLALACACADGADEAWEHFIREYRPVLYRAAEALAGPGSSRELADSLYAELFGVSSSGGERTSLFVYFHGRSSLSCWLRAVLAQRHVDAIRRTRRLEQLDDEDSRLTAPAAPDPERARWLALMSVALERAVSRLLPRDRLRLAGYYAQSLTLAQIGRALGEHEATVSRHLTRTREAIRRDLEQHLRDARGLTEAEIAQCFESVMLDAGTLNLADVLGRVDERKESALERSR